MILSYWDTLSSDTRPVILYGTGNGADKILDACETYGIKVSGVFASDGFVRDRTFRGMHVMSHREVRDHFGDDITVLPAFGTTRPEVIDFFEKLDSLHNVIIPEVPLYGGGIFDGAYLNSHTKQLEKVYDLLSDEESRELFRDTVMFRLTGKLKHLKRCENVRDTLSRLFVDQDITCAFDGGAFKGDSAEDMLASFPNIRRIIACEPDPSTFKKLSSFAASTDTRGVIIPVNSALSNMSGESDCVSSGSRGSGIDGRNRRAKQVKITLDTIDNLCINEKIDYLKLDVEGFEREALEGATETIKRDRPALAVSLYHRTGDIMDLPLLVKDLLGDCRMYLRRPKCIPMWDLTLFVLPGSENR